MYYIAAIHKQYPTYSTDPDLVFKSCGRKYIVVLRKSPYTKTNENRKGVVNPMYAKFRGNMFTVVNIFSKLNPLDIKTEIENSCYALSTVMYTVGKTVVVNDFDNDLENICAEGIHYFKSIEAAFYYEKPFYYTGEIIEYYDNGAKVSKDEYLDGVKHGLCIVYIHNRKFDDCTECIKYYYHGMSITRNEFYKKIYGLVC